MLDAFTYDVFLSHNSKDKPRVRKLAERLKQAGLRVWFDEWNIKPGDDIYLAIERGLESARVQVLCLSPAALGSEWVTLERSTVLFRDPTNQGRRFVPLLLADCTLPDTLRRYKYVDLRRFTRLAFAELLSSCGEGSASKDESKTHPKASSIFKELERAGRHRSTVTRFAWAPNGELIAVPSHDGTIMVWDVKTSEPIATWKAHSRAVYAVAWTPDSKEIISCSWDEQIIRWSIKGHKRGLLASHIKGANALALQPGKSVIAVGTEFPIVHLLDIAGGNDVASLHGHKGNINNLAWSPDGDRIAAACGDGCVYIWHISNQSELVRLRGHQHWVFAVAWSPKGNLVASGSWDGTVRIWNADQRNSICVLEGHKGRITSCSFSPDGRLLASKSHDGSVKLWECSTWTEVMNLPEPSSGRYSPAIAFHPRKQVLATLADRDSTLKLWDISLMRKTSDDQRVDVCRYVNAKVVLLGEGTVGKTSLAHRLIDDRYVVKDRTHGMNVWPLRLPVPTDNTTEREALLWDLAGQEDYRLIHRLFLNETALALLLINPQKDDPFAEAGDWLRALDNAAQHDGDSRQAARLAIFSQVDVGEPKLGKAKLDRFCQDNGLRDWLITSAKNGRNCSDKENGGQPSKLKQLIADSIPWDKLPWTATPRLLAELKNALLKMRDTTDIRLLRFAELAQRLEQTLPSEQFGESDVRTAVKLLANHGLARPLKFGDLVLLQPELLNGYAGAVIRAARAHTDELGCVLEADVYAPTFDFTGVERLKHRPDEELLLRAMVQTFLDHSLCIAEDTPQGRHLVFPSQYRREKDLPRAPDIFVSYTFSGEWQTVWTTLVVRLWHSHEFVHRELWRNAAEFAFDEHILGLKIENRHGEGTATISLYFDKEVTDEVKAIFIEYVHRHLAKYACEVTRDRRYVCLECGAPVKDLDAVRRRLEAKKDFITCQDCDEKVPFVDFIEKRLKSDPVAQRILAMDETATRELDAQALEQILIGHMMAIAGEANQIFRPATMFDHGIDGELEFKDNDGKASGKRIYIQLKSGNSYLRTRKGDGSEIFDVKDDRHLDYWINQPVDVYLVIRQTDDVSGGHAIRWMNVTRYLKSRKNKKSRQILFTGEKLDLEAVWKVRDEFFPPRKEGR